MPLTAGGRFLLAADRRWRLVLVRGLLGQSGAVTLQRQTLGKIGEELAVAELERRGYAVIARRYRTKHGEIDIVAKDGDSVVFVEVKARATAEFGTSAEAVTPSKQRRLVAMAVDYIARNDLHGRPCRFDVVAIDDAESDRPAITVFPSAFDSHR